MRILLSSPGHQGLTDGHTDQYDSIYSAVKEKGP